MFTDAEWPAERRDWLRAACNAVIPPTDSLPGAWEGGVAALLSREVTRGLASSVPALGVVADEMASAHGNPARIAELLAAMASRPSTSPAVDVLIEVCRQGYYGGAVSAPPAGWDEMGYRPWPAGIRVEEHAGAIGIRSHELRAHYDAIVIGSGPGGGVAARLLAERGSSVLILERGHAATNLDLAGDHIHGKRMALYRVAAGPGEGHPRVVQEPDGSSWIADSNGSGDAWGLNAMTLGGGTRVWQGMAWRFLPEDFRMVDTYGRPEGSSLANWPVSYDDMVASYTWAERELGVSGETGPLTSRMPDLDGYPMPALPADEFRRLLGAAADRLGWRHGPIPFAINSVPRRGRPACAACHQCMGHACPVDAKNGAHNAFIDLATARGDVDVIYDALALRITHRGGRATGVDVALTAEDRVVHTAADLIVVAAGAIETPRLVLNSGLGNEQVGRNLHGHVVSLLAGTVDADVPTFRGPGHSVATLDFVHDGSGVVGGGVIFDAFAPYPLQIHEWADALGVPRWGAARREWLRTSLNHLIGAMTIGQEVPTEKSRVSVDPIVVDRWGLPVARIHRATHPASDTNLQYLRARERDWLTEAGVRRAAEVFAPAPWDRTRRSPASEHSAGSMRMGTDPAASAVSAQGLLWGSPNVLVCDGSLHPTNGSVNPTLTLIANAHRIMSGWLAESAPAS